MFLKEPLQVSKYDETHKAILNYIGIKYDPRVYKVFEYKDRTKGSNLLVKPKAPMIKKTIQVATLGEDSEMVGKECTIIGRDGEDYVEY